MQHAVLLRPHVRTLTVRAAPRLRLPLPDGRCWEMVFGHRAIRAACERVGAQGLVGLSHKLAAGDLSAAAATLYEAGLEKFLTLEEFEDAIADLNVMDLMAAVSALVEESSVPQDQGPQGEQASPA